jgi:hypothetical protein
MIVKPYENLEIEIDPCNRRTIIQIPQTFQRMFPVQVEYNYYEFVQVVLAELLMHFHISLTHTVKKGISERNHAITV